MIEVSEKQMAQIEYLIAQSVQGNHLLFDNQVIREVFDPLADPEELAPDAETQQEIERHIEQLILQPSMVQKRAYLERLERETFNLVVRSYFSIVENDLASRKNPSIH